METDGQISADVKETIQKWKAQIDAENALKKDDSQKSRLDIYTGVDIGGTNTRVALSRGHGPFLTAGRFQSKTVTDLVKGLTALAAQLRELLGVDAIGASLDGAGRVLDEGSTIEITNYDPKDRMFKREQLPPSLFPPKNTYFINDLESTCYGISSLSEEGTLGTYFKGLWHTEEKLQLKPVNHLVVAVGTGLGIASLLVLGRGARKIPHFQVLPMEFGHSTLSTTSVAASVAEEEKVVKHISGKVYESKFTPEYEDIVSGRGITYVYEGLVKDVEGVPKTLTAGEIADLAAKDGNPHAKQALLIHFRFLMRVLKNLCIGLQCKGILLAGDNQIVNNPFLEKHLATLREEFLDTPKPHWIEDVVLITQKEPYNLNLAGALYFAKQC